MARVLTISSQVVYGHVGNSGSTFVLQRFGHEVLAIPSVLLSNRPGYAAVAGERIAPAQIENILAACHANGWFRALDAVICGYLPSAAHAEVCARWVKRLKHEMPKCLFVCDPILGDEPQGLYIEAEAAAAIATHLLPLADIATPNKFELAWLAQAEIKTPEDVARSAARLELPCFVVTSAPTDRPDMIANMLFAPSGNAVEAVQRREVRARGTGDFLASIFLAHVLRGVAMPAALKAATVAMDLVLAASEGRSELALIETQDAWRL